MKKNVQQTIRQSISGKRQITEPAGFSKPATANGWLATCCRSLMVNRAWAFPWRTFSFALGVSCASSPHKFCRLRKELNHPGPLLQLAEDQVVQSVPKKTPHTKPCAIHLIKVCSTSGLLKSNRPSIKISNEIDLKYVVKVDKATYQATRFLDEHEYSRI